MGLLNGWTKSQVKKVVDNHFKGRAWAADKDNITGGFTGDGKCAYLTSDGKKCGVGLFVPDGHPAQNSDSGVLSTLERHPDLIKMMPLTPTQLNDLQWLHDKDETFKFATIEKQKQMLYTAIMRLSAGQGL